MLELWGMWSAPSLSLPPGQLWRMELTKFNCHKVLRRMLYFFKEYFCIYFVISRNVSNRSYFSIVHVSISCHMIIKREPGNVRQYPMEYPQVFVAFQFNSNILLFFKFYIIIFAIITKAPIAFSFSYTRTSKIRNWFSVWYPTFIYLSIGSSSDHRFHIMECIPINIPVFDWVWLSK